MYWGNGVCSRGSRRVGNRVVRLGSGAVLWEFASARGGGRNILWETFTLIKYPLCLCMHIMKISRFLRFEV